MTSVPLTQLTFRITGLEDDEEREEALRSLYRELTDTEVEDIALEHGDHAPPGAKAVDPSIVALAVSVLAAGVEPVVQVAHGWLRRRQRPCVIHVQGPGGTTLEIPNVPMKDVHDVVSAWAKLAASASSEATSPRSPDDQP
jgi:hypothetical protein